MKQIEYTDLQKAIIDVIGRLRPFLNKNSDYKIKEIEEDYCIKEPLLTIRQYIATKGCGAYHTFHFVLNKVNVEIDTLSDMLNDEYSVLYPLTNKFYVIGDKYKTEGCNCENYHCDHYLEISPKED